MINNFPSSALYANLQNSKYIKNPVLLPYFSYKLIFLSLSAVNICKIINNQIKIINYV